jgi:hypothetical protein
VEGRGGEEGSIGTCAVATLGYTPPLSSKKIACDTILSATQQQHESNTKEVHYVYNLLQPSRLNHVRRSNKKLEPK